jgi:hypothetical protein
LCRLERKVELLAKLLVVALVLGALWWAIQPRYTFIVRIENGVPRAAKGQVTAAFLQQVSQACAELALSRGWIGGVQRGRRLALAFSRNIPPSCQQRLRNVWALHG